MLQHRCQRVYYAPNIQMPCLISQISPPALAPCPQPPFSSHQTELTISIALPSLEEQSVYTHCELASVLKFSPFSILQGKANFFMCITYHYEFSFIFWLLCQFKCCNCVCAR
jgi:hypothetical protein